MLKIGILHPGLMGIYVAVSALRSGYDVCWASAGRSDATKKRADAYNLKDMGQLRNLCRECQALISVCPPHAALEMAGRVASLSFRGLYLDANAISPGTVMEIDTLLKKTGTIDFVDGGIIGRPMWEKSGTRIYLSGESAVVADSFFSQGILSSSVVGDKVGQASGLKMCYAAYTKGTTALLASILALSETLGVRNTLETQWDENWPNFTAATHQRVCQSTVKAWRFEGEMKEISKTFNEAGLPDGFHVAAMEIFGRQRKYKNSSVLPDFEQVLQSIVEPHRSRKL